MFSLPFSQKASEIFQITQSNVESRNNSIIVPEHLFEVLLENDYEVTLRILEKCKVNIFELKKQIINYLAKIPIVTGNVVQATPDKNFLNFLQKAKNISSANKDEVITTDVLLLAYSSITNNMNNKNIDYTLPHQEIENEIKEMRLGREATGSDPESQINSLKKFFKDPSAKQHFPALGEATISGLMVVADETTGLAKKVEPIIFGGSLQERM